MNSLKRYLNEKWIGLSITLSSILIISILHLIGIFDVFLAQLSLKDVRSELKRIEKVEEKISIQKQFEMLISFFWYQK